MVSIPFDRMIVLPPTDTNPKNLKLASPQFVTATRLDKLVYAEPIVVFTDDLCIIAKSCMPKTTAKQKKRCKPWFNTACKDAMKDRKSVLASFKTNITSENLE